jgi:hypothetical protein
MVKKAETHKKMIRTVLEQLPPYIKHYSPEDQVLLHEFLKLLGKFEKADKNRTELINNYESYTERKLETTEYYHTSFLWFTVAYFKKASSILNWTDFQAISFYEYLAKYLRKDPSYYGVHELIRNQIQLTDDKWEQLQYACTKMLKPLTKEEMKIIGELISIVKKEGIYTLDSRMVRKRLSGVFPKGTKTKKLITALLTNLESRWHLNLNPAAFGIERVFFHLQGIKGGIDEILDFNDPKNMILCLSDIYVSRDQPNDYFGVFYIPTQDIISLTSFLKNHEQKGTLKLKEMSQINTSFRGLSLERYNTEKGWPKMSKTDFQKLVELIKDEKEQQAQTEGRMTNFTPKFDQKWKFDQHQLNIELIRLYCDIKNNYNFSELPLPLVKDKENNLIMKNNIGLLKQLKYNNIMSVDWIPWRLVFEYSLDFYWIIVPSKYLNNLIHFLKTVPFSMIYLTNEKIFLWLHLAPQIVNYLKNKFEWKIYPISYYSNPLSARFNWFNQEELRWKTPYVLNKTE